MLGCLSRSCSIRLLSRLCFWILGVQWIIHSISSFVAFGFYRKYRQETHKYSCVREQQLLWKIKWAIWDWWDEMGFFRNVNQERLPRGCNIWAEILAMLKSTGGASQREGPFWNREALGQEEVLACVRDKKETSQTDYSRKAWKELYELESYGNGLSCGRWGSFEMSLERRSKVLIACSTLSSRRMLALENKHDSC